MTLSRRRVRAILVKELREYRRNGFILATMLVVPVVFAIPPLINIFAVPAAASRVIARHDDLLLYLIGIPAIVPAAVAAYSIVGERQQGTLEPLLTTPIRREEILLAKTLACFVPSLAISYLVYTLTLLSVVLFAQPGVASAMITWPGVVAQVIFTPLVAGWSIWIGTAISARSRDFRVAQQLGTLAGLPPVAVASVVSFGLVHPTLKLALAFGIGLAVVDRIGWRVMAAAFVREKLIAGTR